MEGRAGDDVRLRLRNELPEPTNLHYHGLHDRVHRAARERCAIHHATLQLEAADWKCQETHL